MDKQVLKQVLGRIGERMGAAAAMGADQQADRAPVAAGGRARPVGRRAVMGLLAGLCIGAVASSGTLTSGELGPCPAYAKGGAPEDVLKGQLFISDSSFPTRWSSVGEFVSRVKKNHKSSLTYDKKTKKLQVYYAAFFALPVDDVQVNFAIYDITNGMPNKVKKGSWEAFMGRKGERVLFNSVELDQEDIEMNKKYLFAIERRGSILAKGEIILRGEAPKYSGKVDFTEEETKKKE